MDIICAVCAEPWDARGMHYTTSDLDAEKFHDLLNGWGCPCCRQKGVNKHDLTWQPDPAAIEAWARSVARASEGTVCEFELEPCFLQYRLLLSQGVSRIEAAVTCRDNPVITYAMIGAPEEDTGCPPTT